MYRYKAILNWDLKKKKKKVTSFDLEMELPNLENVSIEDLFAEMLRRMKCATKGEKRVILVGRFIEG